MISQTAEYALRAIVHLASRGQTYRKVAQIAESTGVPSGYLSKIMLSLARAGVVKSKRGFDGGFILASEPEELSILVVINAVDPIQRFAECPLGIAGHGSHLCRLHRRLNQTAILLEKEFGEAKVSALTPQLEDGRGQAKCRFPMVPAAAC